MANVPPRVVELVETFEQHIEAYRSQQYNETQVRREFIDPFFEALGWDITNKAGYAQAYKDVIHEDAIKVGSATKAPDYCFRIGGVRKFFLEAKKPSVDIQGDPHPAYQLRRYAWSAKLLLSVVTDFEEFAVYDCQMRPRHTDKADVARIMLFSYEDYLGKWSEIADIFSKEAILKGSFDKFAAATKGKRGTSTVDKEFLAEIEKWRSMLARIIALRNRTLSVREINFSVQRIIDRILFLRMCEDRGIEPYGQLQAISSGERTYPRLCEVFERADQRYNSGLFHFHDEPDRHEPPDQLTPNLIIDDKDLKWILHSLYYPQSPYEFSVLPAEILGNVYEQFLGKVITLTSGHRADVEDKPEVKKAGGVYYTPSYIVDYIVKNTVGKLLGASPNTLSEAEGSKRQNSLTPKQVSNTKILDPACGSGSFLIGAYQYLLDWHLRYYTDNDPEKHAKGREPKICQVNSIRHCEESFDETQDKPGDEVAGMAYATISNYRLTITEKKRILLSNIFGVDIDSQAVEVTKLSLLLKVLEGESSETIENQYRLFHERALPDLAANIKCGNSLIGPDFFDTPVIPSAPVPSVVEGNNQLRTMNNELYQKINAFDWHAEFPQVFTRQNPGFDVVIGNPPYIRMESFKPVKEYLRARYKAHEERADIYAYFLERGLWILRPIGRLGMIVSNKFMKAKYGRPLRKVLSENSALDLVADFAGANVFEGATVRTVVLVALKTNAGTDRRVAYVPVPNRGQLDALVSGQISMTDYAKRFSFEIALTSFREDGWQLLPPDEAKLLETLRTKSQSLESWLGKSALFGLKTGLNEAFVIHAEKRRDLLREHAMSSEVIRPILFGKDVRRYFIEPGRQWVIYCHPDKDVEDFPAVRDRLAPFKQTLTKRATKQEWYELQQPATNLVDINRRPKIVYPIIANECRFALDRDGYFINDKTFLLPTDDLALLGVMNSKVANFYFARVCAALEGRSDRYLEFRAQYVNLFPLPTRFAQWKEKPKLVRLVDQMLDFHKQLAAAKIPDEKTQIQRQIDATDKQIDQLVYELYGLTEEEIGIVEDSSKNKSDNQG